MAKDEDLAQLRQGAAVWNDWRTQHLVYLADLSGADLCEANLWRADLERATLFEQQE